MKTLLACFLVLVLVSNPIWADDAILTEATNSLIRQEQFHLADGKQITYSVTDYRNNIVVQRVDGFMIHQDGKALHRRVEDRLQTSVSSIAVYLSSDKFQAHLNRDVPPKTVLPKAVDDMHGQPFAMVEFDTDRRFNPCGIVSFAPAIATTNPKYSVSSNYEKWRSAGNKAQYTAPNDSGPSDAKLHKFVLTNWPEENVPELTLWVNDEKRIAKRASKEEKFGFSDVVSILETVMVDGVEFPAHFAVERTRGGSNPKSFKTVVKAKVSETTAPVPAEWFTLEHYGVPPREQPKFAAPPSNNWKIWLGSISLLASVFAMGFYLRRRRQ